MGVCEDRSAGSHGKELEKDNLNKPGEENDRYGTHTLLKFVCVSYSVFFVSLCVFVSLQVCTLSSQV